MVKRFGRGGDEAVQTGLGSADQGGDAGQTFCSVDAKCARVVQRLTCGACLLRGIGEFGGELGDGAACVLHIVGGLGKGREGLGFGGVFGTDGFAVNRIDDFGKYFGYGGDECGIDRAVHSGRADVGDFGGDGAGFFVDVILQSGPTLAAGHHAGEIVGKVFGNDDGCVCLAGFHLVHGLGFGDEGPAELVVASHLLDDLIAEVLLADERVVGAVVIVGDGDGDAFGIAVRVPEADDVVPRIQWRDEHHAEQDHPCGRHLEQAQEVASEDLEDIAH